MRIGILTFYRGTNYGALLQAFALESKLAEMGHEVEIIRLGCSADVAVESVFRLLMVKIRFILGCIKWQGLCGAAVRRRRSEEFSARLLRVSQEELHDWSVFKTRYDLVVVGSDQVWHAHNGHPPLLYLLNGAPIGTKAVSYAASFGMITIPDSIKEYYVAGFGRFSAISTREEIGLRFVAECGAKGVHVVDPTLLHPADFWRKQLPNKNFGRQRKLVCYFLTEDPEKDMSQLIDFARSNDCSVHILVDGTIPRTFRLSGLYWRFRMVCASVKIRFDAGPLEFLEEIATAQWVVTDSFHGSVFSYLFNTQMRVLRPPARHWRRMMFARLEEFASDVSDGVIVMDTLKDALKDFASGSRIEYSCKAIERRRELSECFIKHVAGSVCNE